MAAGRKNDRQSCHDNAKQCQAIPFGQMIFKWVETISNLQKTFMQKS